MMCHLHPDLRPIFFFALLVCEGAMEEDILLISRNCRCEFVGHFAERMVEKGFFQGTKGERQEAIGLGIYAVWHIWKERNKRIFQDKSANVETVISLLKDDIDVLWIAWSEVV